MSLEHSVYEPIDASNHHDRIRKYGRTGQPIPATQTYRRIVSTMARSGIRVEKWVIINERNDTASFVITYNGVAGAHFDLASNTQWLNWESLRPLLEDYQYLPADECPVAIPISRRPAPQRERQYA